MDVAVDQKREKGQLQSIVQARLLGEGLLERARATTLGLLGGAAVVGLAMLALVFNQGWPLIAGAPVPPLPPREQDVAKARVVATSAHRQADVDVSQPRRPGGDTSGAGPAPAAQGGSTQAPSSELAVVRSAPVEQQTDAPPSGGHNSPAPADQKTSPTPQTQTERVEQVPASSPVSTPAPAPAPEATPPPPTASGAPESSVPPWSNGKGHAYGRAGREEEDWEDDD